MLDLSLVVYRPNEELLSATLESLAGLLTEFGRLYVLVSGSDDDRRVVEILLKRFKMEAESLLIHRYDNLGFASGHNLLLQLAFQEKSHGVVVINPDIEISPGALQHLASRAAELAEDSLVGPVIRQIGLEGDLGAIDSAGIVWTATGRHFDHLHGHPDIPADGSVARHLGVTSACLLVTRGAYQRIVETTGYFFDDLFIAYREDAELGVRASLCGIRSVVINIDGFAHVRSVRGAKRGNGLADLLGVRNRFIMKWRMGAHRPGSFTLSNLRDVLVVLGVVLTERSSWSGLLEAWRFRRYIRNTSPYKMQSRDMLPR